MAVVASAVLVPATPVSTRRRKASGSAVGVGVGVGEANSAVCWAGDTDARTVAKKWAWSVKYRLVAVMASDRIDPRVASMLGVAVAVIVGKSGVGVGVGVAVLANQSNGLEQLRMLNNMSAMTVAIVVLLTSSGWVLR